MLWFSLCCARGVTLQRRAVDSIIGGTEARPILYIVYNIYHFLSIIVDCGRGRISYPFRRAVWRWWHGDRGAAGMRTVFRRYDRAGRRTVFRRYCGRGGFRRYCTDGRAVRGRFFRRRVLRVGLEPTTLRSSGECSSRLSYLSDVRQYTLSTAGGEYAADGFPCRITRPRRRIWH